MPDLSGAQFHQPELDNFYSHHVTPHGLRGRLPGATPAEDTRTHKRGAVGEGQQVMNFDLPAQNLEVSTGGLIPVDNSPHSRNDPNWDSRGWSVGGMRREEVESDAQSEDHPDGPQIVDAWESAPVVEVGPDDQIFTAQGSVTPPSVDHDPDTVDELRELGEYAFEDPATGAKKLPWLAQVAGKRYMMEGHHRAIAARTSQDGAFSAHEIQARDWDELLSRAGYAPRTASGRIIDEPS